MNFLFLGYLAGFLLIGAWVARLAVRLGTLEKRLSRLHRD
jgi:CcmD family protein